jgi:hypothetical protein
MQIPCWHSSFLRSHATTSSVDQAERRTLGQLISAVPVDREPLRASTSLSPERKQGESSEKKRRLAGGTAREGRKLVHVHQPGLGLGEGGTF